MPSWYSVDKDFYSAHPVRGARRGREKGENILLMANKGKSLILLVLTVLPALLILCDGLICRTTRGMTHLSRTTQQEVSL